MYLEGYHHEILVLDMIPEYFKQVCVKMYLFVGVSCHFPLFLCDIETCYFHDRVLITLFE